MDKAIEYAALASLDEALLPLLGQILLERTSFGKDPCRVALARAAPPHGQSLLCVC